MNKPLGQQHRTLPLIFAVLTVGTLHGQSIKPPLTHVEACRSFADAIVQVDTDTMHGTGFIVDSDGWVVTALHIVADPDTFVKYGNLTVSVLGELRPIPAEVVSPINKLTSDQDFTILKINKTKLPNLELGNEGSVESGSPISIIGLPLSAMFGRFTPNRVPQFCLTGTIAAQTAFPLGGLNFVHTVYFQGVSIKGISGAPIISLVTGKVIGIVSTRMTGISQALAWTRQHLGEGGEERIGNFSSVGTPKQIIDTLDTQLANGLGSGTGTSDAANALSVAKRNYERQHQHH